MPTMLATNDFPHHVAESCSKNRDSMRPIDTQIQGIIDRLASLDRPVQKFDFEPLQCNMDTVAEVDDESDTTDAAGCDDVFPPPKPYYDRHAAMQPTQRSLTRSQSFENLKKSPENLKNKAKDFLKSKTMTQSMPNLSGGRSEYNRRVGNSLTQSTSDLPGGSRWQHRAAEFDQLLQDLL
jgi:hypothetical protein